MLDNSILTLWSRNCLLYFLWCYKSVYKTFLNWINLLSNKLPMYSFTYLLWVASAAVLKKYYMITNINMANLISLPWPVFSARKHVLQASQRQCATNFAHVFVLMLLNITNFTLNLIEPGRYWALNMCE